MTRLRLPAMSVATKTRVGLVVVTLLYAGLNDDLTQALPWILLVVFLDLVATGAAALEVELPIPRQVLGWAFLGVSAFLSGLAFTVVGESAAGLAFLPITHAGRRGGGPGFLVSVLVALTGAGSALVLWEDRVGIGKHALLLWTLAIVTISAMGIWAPWLRPVAVDTRSADALEARELLRRLHELASERGTELDAIASASLLLERIASQVPHDRSVVLHSSPEEVLQPLAFRGTRRLDPRTVPDGELSCELLEGGTRTLVWDDDIGTRSLLLAPFGSGPGPARGVIVLDRAREHPFTSDEVASVEQSATVATLDLEVALLFASLRSVAAIEERRLLAQEMHDGIAQDLAALGFQIDAVRALTPRESTETKVALEALRADLGQVIKGLRTRISDLAMTHRPERSLAAVLAASVQAFGSATGIRTTFSVHEGQIRLPAHLEAAIVRVVMDFLDDARTRGVSRVDVATTLSATEVVVTLGHDGADRISRSQLGRHLVGFTAVALEKDRDVPGGLIVRVRQGPSPSATTDICP